MGKSLVIKEGYIRQCHSKLAVLLWDFLKYNGRSKGIILQLLRIEKGTLYIRKTHNIREPLYIRKSHNRSGI